MRLHRLELSGFGPFAGTEIVDLDALGADGLFLVQGDTGAGKTTLLDAVAFALFGRVPGPRNEAKRLRCDRAPADVVTMVRLEASIGGHRLEITRRPEYERPKARGNGSTLQRGKVSLRWIGATPSGHTEEGLTRADEVGDAVVDLLGMSADQFFQVVLLPQGDFARFLRADTAERGDLLERLFDTGRFGRIEDWFANLRREAGAGLRACDDQVRQLAARVAEAARVELTDAPDHRWLADVRDRLADLAESAADAAIAARVHRDRSAATWDRARLRAERVERLRTLLERRRNLDVDRPRVESERRLLARHARTGPIVAAASVAQDARVALTLAKARRRAADRDLAALDRSTDNSNGRTGAGPAGTGPGPARTGAGPVGADGDPDLLDLGMLADDPVAVHAAASADRDLAGALTGMIAESAEQDRDLAQLTRARRRHHRDEVAAVDVEQRLAGLPARITELEARVTGARSAKEMLPTAKEQMTAAESVLRAARSVPMLDAELATAAVAATDAADQHQAAVDVRQALVDTRIAGMAAELAARLREGDACPVCCSTTHPRLAQPEGRAVTAEEIRAAEEAEHRAAAARVAAVQQRERLVAAVGRAREIAVGHDVAAAERCLLESTARHTRLVAVARNLDALLGLREAAGKALFEQGLRREDLAASLTAGSTEIGVLSQRTERRAARLRHARGGHESVVARRNFLLGRAAALDAVAAAAMAVGAALAALERAERELLAAVVAAGFDALDDALAAAAVDADGLRRRIRAADDAAIAVDTQLRDPQLEGLSADEQVDLVGIGRAAESAAAAADRAISLAHALTAQRDQVAVASSRLQASWLDREPIALHEAEVSALTEVMHGRGQNALGMSLRTYVLAERLKQVAGAAGQRLDRMSAGRYTFVHSTDREARGKAGGLGLDILDGWSGLVRSTKTLSGGESFLASLALALGLADIVAAEAGGRVLDTLFVDEGFGSLDPDTLDLVMGTLDELRAGGRVVGVVSHVDELRQRIPSQVRVCRTPQGSTLQVSTG
jgi:exonuclease SbcC